jgi:hypothetical protein
MKFSVEWLRENLQKLINPAAKQLKYFKKLFKLEIKSEKN